MEFKDYYSVMCVKRAASPDEIKRAFRHLARKFHPDVSTEPGAEEKFKELAEAYEVLRDPQKRAAYDELYVSRHRRGSRTPPPNHDQTFQHRAQHAGADSSHSHSDFFESLFGQGAADRQRASGRKRRAERPPAPSHDEIFITLEEAYRGALRPWTLHYDKVDPLGRAVRNSRTLTVKIPKGAVEGQHIQLPGQGVAAKGAAGEVDLYLEVRFEPHKWFRADGRDIYLNVPVTPWEAALGQTITVPTLGGSVELKLPVNAQSGQTLRLRGRGLPGIPSGDQYVILDLVLPLADTAEARALYRAMANLMPLNPRSEMDG